MAIEYITEFKAVGSTVVAVLDDGLTEQICRCRSVPGWIAEDVARQIAEMLNAPKIQGIGFTMPKTEGDR